MKRCVCKICKHIWTSRINSKPVACARCKRYDWDRPINKQKKGR